MLPSLRDEVKRCLQPWKPIPNSDQILTCGFKPCLVVFNQFDSMK